MTTPRIKLGRFSKGSMSPLEGSIGGLGMGTIEVMAMAATSADGKPYLKLIGDPEGAAFEIGAAFPKIKDGLEYYSVNLESPMLAAPINAALFPDKNDSHFYNLVWNRLDGATPAAAAKATGDNDNATQLPLPKPEEQEPLPQQKRGGRRVIGAKPAP
ncbi:MAG: DUF736 family protein [Negativicutes bacterium]|nr:DUF736 family protein [Negativicutes bacterium]